MPLISIEAVHPTKEQKERLIAELTKTAGEILGVDEKFFYVLVKENDLDNWGVGGKTLAQFLAEQKHGKIFIPLPHAGEFFWRNTFANQSRALLA